MKPQTSLALPSPFNSPVVWLSTWLLAGTIIFWPQPGAAHVKWFAPYNIGEAPAPLSGLNDGFFWLLLGIVCLALWGASQLERAWPGRRLADSLDAVSAPLPERIEPLIRAATAAFFVSLWAIGGMILTPELRTESGWAVWLQLAIAAGMLSRRTIPASALGICVLYGYGIAAYGLFHMLDYPFFIGLAGYLALSGASDRKLLDLRMPVIRWSLAISLMWASIEKLAYAHWTFPILDQYPFLTLGLDHHDFMHLAGLVEFSLGFALLWTPLVRRAAAAILLTLFTLAILQFGRIDAIGHMIIMAMVASILLDPSKAPVLRPTVSPVAIGGSFGLFLGLYYSAHSLLVW